MFNARELDWTTRALGVWKCARFLSLMSLWTTVVWLRLYYRIVFMGTLVGIPLECLLKAGI